MLCGSCRITSKCSIIQKRSNRVSFISRTVKGQTFLVPQNDDKITIVKRQQTVTNDKYIMQ